MSFLIGFLSNILRLIFPANFWYNMALGVFSTWADIPMMCMTGVLLAMTVDINEIKYGKRMLGYSTSAISFGAKVASGLGASLVGWMLAIANYNAAPDTQAVRFAIYGFSIIVPALMFLAMFLMIRKFDAEKVIAEHRTQKNS